MLIKRPEDLEPQKAEPILGPGAAPLVRELIVIVASLGLIAAAFLLIPTATGAARRAIFGEALAPAYSWTPERGLERKN